jgi:hypothetical protein
LTSTLPPAQDDLGPVPRAIATPSRETVPREKLQGISQRSCGVLTKLGPQIHWVTSYVIGDKIYCVYIAPNEEMVREDARQGGFPANRASEVKSVIDPTTAEV